MLKDEAFLILVTNNSKNVVPKTIMETVSEGNFKIREYQGISHASLWEINGS